MNQYLATIVNARRDGKKLFF
uniref:Uncharacterized protein n=1 Tax=Arundo donax TaxID=35708 RepID=A0A0A9GGT8_ARUDO